MNKRRLRDLVAVLRTVPRKRFDMSRFAHDCGTPACAAGHYMARFPKRDLHPGQGGSPTTRECCWSSSGALAIHFGLDMDGVSKLFYSGNEHTTPKQHAKVVEKYIATH